MVVGLSWETLQPSETEWEQEADLGYTALVAHPRDVFSPVRPHLPEVLQPPRASPPVGDQISKNIHCREYFTLQP